MWTVGNGPTVVAVHGGPGFDHEYMMPALLPLSAHFRLVFYDQRSRGSITLADLTEQLRRILAAAGSDGPPIVLAHSWGTYLAFACLMLPNAPVVRGAMLVAPMPLTLKGFDRAAARFEQSLPRPAPTSVRELFSYYLAKRNRSKPSILRPHFDAAVFRKIMVALQGSHYDFRKEAAALPEATHLVFGRQDRLSEPSDFKGVLRHAEVTSIAGAAHLAFSEQPEAFRRLFVRAFGWSRSIPTKKK